MDRRQGHAIIKLPYYFGKRMDEREKGKGDVPLPKIWETA